MTTDKRKRLDELSIKEKVMLVLSTCVLVLGFVVLPIVHMPLVGLVLIAVFGCLFIVMVEGKR